MAWIYLAESAESPLPWHLGFNQSPIVKTTDTLMQSSFLECQTDDCAMRRYGQTFQPCVVACFQMNPLMSSTVDFHARTSVLQAMEKAWLESEADFFVMSSDSLKKYGHLLSSSKMFPLFVLEDFERSSEHLPIYGMTVGGRVFLPQKLEPHTLEKGGSYWQSPVADDACNRKLGKWNSRGEPKLSAQVLFPTPTASDYGTGGNGVRKGKQKQILSLGTMARKNLWPTPMASDYKAGWGPGDVNRQSPRLQTKVGGQLNPTWVEWLMGYPTEWTELSALVTQWFQLKPEKHLRD